MAAAPTRQKEPATWELVLKRNPVERLKQAKAPLGIRDELPALIAMGYESVPEEDVVRLQWWGLYHDKPKVGTFMLRLKIPSGILPPAKLRAIGEVSNRYGRADAELSTRQCIQLHWLRLDELPNVFTDLDAAGITTAGISGIAAQIGTNGKLQFTGGSLLQVQATTTGLVSGSEPVTSLTSLLNGGNYQTAAGAWVTFASGETQALTITAGGTNYVASLDNTNADTIGHTVTALNAALANSGVYAVQTDSTHIALEGASSFTVSTGAASGAGSVFSTAAGAVAITAPTNSATSTGNALNAITSIDAAVRALGLVQGKVGTDENQLQYAMQLAQSQISSFSGAQSSIRDADVAAEAANLSKAQVLAQASVAALVQANAMPQAVLALLKG